MWDRQQTTSNRNKATCSMEEDIGATVEVYVYDLTKGMARMMSQMVLGEWHHLCILAAVWGVNEPIKQLEFSEIVKPKQCSSTSNMELSFSNNQSWSIKSVAWTTVIILSCNVCHPNLECTGICYMNIDSIQGLWVNHILYCHTSWCPGPKRL